MAVVSRKPLLKNLCFLALLAAILVAGYVLSYAPVYRLRHGTFPKQSAMVASSPWLGMSGLMTGYAPVEWLMDRTILREPLCRWADLWGVGFGVRAGIRVRELFGRNTANRGDVNRFNAERHGS